MPNSPDLRDDDVPSARPTSGSEPATRPPGHVLGAAILLVVIGVLGVLFSWYQLSQLGAHGERVHTETLVLVWVLILLSGTQVVSGLYVLPGRNWARVLGIVFTSLNLLAGAISLFSGNVVAVVGIGVNIGLLVMLNRDDVQRWCGG